MIFAVFQLRDAQRDRLGGGYPLQSDWRGTGGEVRGEALFTLCNSFRNSCVSATFAMIVAAICLLKLR